MSYGCVLLAADGLALGAAAGLGKVDVELIIFLAIMLHKVSAACLPAVVTSMSLCLVSLSVCLSVCINLGSGCIWIHILLDTRSKTHF